MVFPWPRRQHRARCDQEVSLWECRQTRAWRGLVQTSSAVPVAHCGRERGTLTHRLHRCLPAYGGSWAIGTHPRLVRTECARCRGAHTYRQTNATGWCYRVACLKCAECAGRHSRPDRVWQIGEARPPPFRTVQFPHSLTMPGRVRSSARTCIPLDGKEKPCLPVPLWDCAFCAFVQL